MNGILNAAAEAGCTLLLSEDMADGFTWRGTAVVNPFAAAIDERLTRLGVTVRFVEGRLRLASLTPVVFQALADGEITLDIAKAYAKAATRARYSYFDQHIIRTDDGCYWVADEGDYETLMQDLIDRIVHTRRCGLAGAGYPDVGAVRASGFSR